MVRNRNVDFNKNVRNIIERGQKFHTKGASGDIGGLLHFILVSWVEVLILQVNEFICLFFLN